MYIMDHQLIMLYEATEPSGINLRRCRNCEHDVYATDYTRITKTGLSCKACGIHFTELISQGLNDYLKFYETYRSRISTPYGHELPESVREVMAMIEESKTRLTR